MSANAIPPEDWRVISAGVNDPDELARLRMAYTLGGYRCKRLVLDAIAPITMPDAAPIAVLVPEADRLERDHEEASWEYLRQFPHDR